MRAKRSKMVLYVLLTSIGACCWVAFAQSGDTLQKEDEHAIKPILSRDHRLTWMLAAANTWKKHVGPYHHGYSNKYIPLSCWHKDIRDLDPLYVYHHVANIVVVLKHKDNIEEGVFIHQPFSSPLAIWDGCEMDGFKLTLTDHDKYYYTFIRKRTTNQPLHSDSQKADAFRSR